MNDAFDTPDAFIDAYAAGTDRAALLAQLEAIAARGDVDELRALWKAASSNRWGIFDRRRSKLAPLAGDVELALAGAGRADALGTLGELLARDRKGRDADDLGKLANRFAQEADAGALEALAERADELPLSLFINAVQGAVLHGAAVASVPSLVSAWRRRAGEHPLGRFPLERLPAEAELALPKAQRDRTVSRSTRSPASAATSDVDALDVASMTERPELLPAVRSWVERSNGRAEWVDVALVTAAPSIAPAQLVSLGLRSLSGVAVSDLRLCAVTVEEVLGQLFSASLGGAYAKAPGLGDARRAAWSSLAMLCGLDGDAELAVVEAAARRHAWWSFGPVGDWFYDVAWDLGLVALGEDGLRFVVLSATDTD